MLFYYNITGINYTQSTSLITSSLWHESDSRVMSYIPHKSSGDHLWRIEDELGFRFPSVMGEYVEQLIEDIWTKVKDGRYIIYKYK